MTAASSLRVALVQLNPTVGDLAGNAEAVVAAMERAARAGADLAVFPELVLCGYPPRDLLDRPAFVEDVSTRLAEVAARAPASLTSFVGFVDRVDVPVGPRLRNAIAVLRDGRVVTVVHKRLLPTYDVFDEARWFGPGDTPGVVEVAGVKVGISICEDVWNHVPSPCAERVYAVDPMAELVAEGAEVLVNVAASPFTRDKRLGRPAMLGEVARRTGRPLVFVNQVGGHDDLVFDGASAVYGPDGSLRAELASFAEDEAIVTLDTRGPLRPQPLSDEAAVLDALSLGVADYARRCGFRGALVGLSGGIDSALVAAIAARALGPENVTGVAMPTRYSSEHSLADARALASALGIRFSTVSIDRLFQSYLDELGPVLDDFGPKGPGDVTFENVQARIRGNVLMALSNRLGLLLLTTGNKSEIAVGYCTLYGDMAGGLAVISDLFKTFVYRVSREVNRQAGRELIPESTLTKPPSAELRPDQKDSDSLPEYDELDAILVRYVEQARTPESIIAEGYPAALVERVVRMVRLAEHKRRQMPPGLVVTRKAFGPGRRVPIAQRYGR